MEGEKVISSFSVDLGDDIRYTLIEMHVGHGDFGMMDRVELVQSDYVANKASGEVRLEETMLRRIRTIGL